MTDPDQLEEVIAAYENTLYRAALAVLGDAHEAEDAVQDAFLRYLEKAPDFPDAARERAWLLKVTVNGCKSRLRSPWRRRTAPLLDTYPAADREERELLEAYRTQLKGAVDPRERPALQNALVHTRALMARKEQMKAEFISKLRWISDRAQEALEELEGEDTLEYLIAALRPEVDLPPPEPLAPPDEPGRRETDHAAAEPPDRDEFQEPDRPAGVPEEPTAP